MGFEALRRRIGTMRASRKAHGKECFAAEQFASTIPVKPSKNVTLSGSAFEDARTRSRGVWGRS